MSISVYITSYNQKEYLIEAIESVLKQTLKVTQIIIVDDASSDSSQEIILGYKSRYPKLVTTIFHEINQGIAQTRIDALKAVTSEFVTYVDGDDRLLPAKIENELNILIQNPNRHIVYSNNFYINEDGKRIGTWIKKKLPPDGNVFCDTFARDYPKNNLFRMELLSYDAWKKIGFHDPNLNLLEDWEMRIRLCKNYLTIYNNEPLSEIRVHEHGLSKSPAIEKLYALEYIWQKNNSLLKDIDREKCNYIEEKIHQWKARFLRMRAKEELGLTYRNSYDKKLAINLYLESLRYHYFFDIDFLLGLILPNQIYQLLRSSYKKIRY